MLRPFLLSIILLSTPLFSARYSAKSTDTSVANPTLQPTLKFSAYLDLYYAYYSDSVGAGHIHDFPTVSPRSNSFGLNTAVLTAQYDAESERGVLSLHFGDIARYSWSSTTFANIFEAHAGIRLARGLWCDAGFFRTHVGMEGLLPKENIAASIAIPTYFEPYFESGVRLSYEASEDLSMSLYVLNGYNIFEDNNSAKSLGLLVNYALSKKTSLGFSNYTGDDAPDGDSLSNLRLHNCVYVNYQSGKWKMQASVDHCLQQHADLHADTIKVIKDSVTTLIEDRRTKKTASMISAIASVKYQAYSDFSVYARAELFQDPQGFMSTIFTDASGTRTGLKSTGLTIGGEYDPTEKSYVRLEARELMLDSQQKIFRTNGSFTANRLEILFHIGISF